MSRSELEEGRLRRIEYRLTIIEDQLSVLQRKKLSWIQQLIDKVTIDRSDKAMYAYVLAMIVISLIERKREK